MAEKAVRSDAVRTGGSHAPATPPPGDAIDPAVERIAVALTELFNGHGIDCDRHDEWVTPNGKLPALRGFWTPHEHSGRLDIEVRVEPGQTIVESFAGMAANAPQTHLDDALVNFVVNSFHVLLSALWHDHDPEQIVTETWEVGNTPFTAFIGNIGTRGTVGGVAPPLPAAFLPTLERAIRSERLSAQLHWFRFYFGMVRNEPIFEALRDNEPWEAGIDALKSVDWGAYESFYSARLFLMLRPASN